MQCRATIVGPAPEDSLGDTNLGAGPTLPQFVQISKSFHKGRPTIGKVLLRNVDIDE